jgi:hypothetical protein
MATQIVMDHNGDTRHNFDAKDEKAVLEAERRFKELTGADYRAATRTAGGGRLALTIFLQGSRVVVPRRSEPLLFKPAKAHDQLS